MWPIAAVLRWHGSGGWVDAAGGVHQVLHLPAMALRLRGTCYRTVGIPSADPRVIVATYRVTPGEQQQIRKAAAQNKCTVTDLIRRGLQAQGALPAPK